MVRVKICGLKTAEEVQLVAEMSGDALGVVVDISQSPRSIDPEEAKDLIAVAPPFLYTVAVTMPKTVDEAVSIYEVVRPDALQVHGVPTPSLLAEIRESVPCKLIVALPLNSQAVIPWAPSTNPLDVFHALADYADAILVDTYVLGGSGVKSDWNHAAMIRKALSPRPLILAGGLTHENVAEAVRNVEPFAVDVASGVESKPGVKNPDLVRLFIRRVKGI